MSVPRVAVVVASKNRSASVGRLLDLLAQQSWPVDQVVVVDDGSTDGTAELLAERAENSVPLTVVRLEASVGPAGARNRGTAVACSDLVAFTDDDCRPADDWVERLMRGFQAGADVVLGTTTADPDAYAGRGPWDHAMVTSGADPMYSTCNIAYRREWLERLGGFDESFTGTRGGAQWGEDTDLGLRAVEQGAKVAFDEHCLVEHDVVARSWSAYCVAGLRRQGVPHLVAKHPAFREQLTAGVFLNQAHLWAPLALVGAVGGAALAVQSAALGGVLVLASAVPWLRFRTGVWPVHARRRALPYVLPMLWAADLLETGFVAAAAVKSRVLVL